MDYQYQMGAECYVTNDMFGNLSQMHSLQQKRFHRGMGVSRPCIDLTLPVEKVHLLH